MPDTKLSDLTKLLGSAVASADVWLIADMSVPETKGILHSEVLTVFQPYDATLLSLAAFNTNGILVQTAADTFAGRTLTGTAARIAVTNGDGVAGNPQVDIDAAYVGQATITTLGTITTGSWTATVIGPLYGGTGLSAYTTGDVIYASATNTLARLAGNITTTKQFLSQTGDGANSAAPVWAALTSGDIPTLTDYVKRDGSTALTADWDAGSFKITAQQLESDVTTGTAPLIVASTTLVANLNADRVDGIEGAELIQRDGSVTFTANQAMGGFRLTGVGTPVAGTDAVNKDYVDAVAITGLKWKQPVVCATTANITLSGEQTIDGILTSGSRVLVKDQSTGAENGIYVSAAGAWARASDMQAGTTAAGTAVFVEQGTVSADVMFVCTDDTLDVVGTDSLTFSSYGTGGGGGETNTASNVNVGGVGVFKQKTGVNLEFRGVNAGSAKLTVTLDAGNNEIDVDLGSVALADLSDVTGTTGSGTVVVMQTSPVLTTPQINDTSADHQYIIAVSELIANRTITLPLLTGNDEFAFLAHAATLTNKTIALGANTISGTAAQFDTACSDANFAYAGGAYHDGFSDYVAAEHIDWTAAAAGTIDISNLPVGTKGQQLTVNEAETALEFGLASKYLPARKGSAGTITAGKPVYISGYNVGGWVEVEETQADDPAKMPAVGISYDALTNASTDRVLLIGNSSGIVDTSSWSVGDAIYVSATVGTLTNVRPTAAGTAVQKIGTVARVHAVNGELIVVGAGRSNDIPNTLSVNGAAHFGTIEDNGTKTGAFTIDWTAGNKHAVAINAAGPLAVTFTSPGGCANLLLKITQGATPGTLTWPASVKWQGGTVPTLSSVTGKVDIVSFFFDGTTYYGVSSLDFS